MTGWVSRPIIVTVTQSLQLGGGSQRDNVKKVRDGPLCNIRHHYSGDAPREHVVASCRRSDWEADPKRMTRIAEPFFREHCWRCHGPKVAKGDLRLDQLSDDVASPAVFERWHAIVERLQSGEMPPKDEPRPPAKQSADLARRISTRLEEAAAQQRSEGRVVLRRLNRVEYETPCAICST